MGDLELTKHDPVLTDSNSGYDLLRATALIRTMEGGTGHWQGISYAVSNVNGVAYLSGKASFSRPLPGTNSSLSRSIWGT